MYLIINDRYKIADDTRGYFVCSKEYFESVLENFPEVDTLKKNDIEGAIIFTSQKDQVDNCVFEVECVDFICTETSLKVVYGKSKSLESKCGTVRKNLFGLLKRKGLVKNGLTPFVSLVDINELYKVLGLENPKLKGKLNEIEELKKHRKWMEIVKFFGDLSIIEKLECWDNLIYLNEVVFALSKVVEPGYKKIDNIEKKRLEKIFFKAVNRSLAMEPQNIAIKSILAYHYYCLFLDKKDNSDGLYDKANELYLDLIKNSKNSYKEKYRYFKIQQKYFDSIKWKLKKEWMPKVDEILSGFKQLIEEYKTLSVDKQKRMKKEYIGSLYSYSVFAIENLLRVWEAYSENIIFQKDISQYILSKDRLKMINDIDGYLKEIVQISGLEERGNNIDLRQKPSYIDFLYRQAQIEQIKGIVYVIKDSPPDKYKQYFIQSNAYLEKLFNLAKRAQEKIKILYPHYAKETRAINHYFLKNENLIHGNFNNAKPYMLYEEAVIYCLQNDFDLALQTLNKIPEKDTCYNKANLLKERITNENR